MPGYLNKNVIRDFWAQRSNEDNSRWTSYEILEYEKRFIQSWLPPKPIKLLDLGSGSGHLSKSIKRKGDKLIAVDQEPKFVRFFNEPECEFICNNVESYEFANDIDFILCFGVINSLTDSDLIQLFEKISAIKNPNLQIVIKAQFSDSNEYVIDEFSKELSFQYSARYLPFDHFASMFRLVSEKMQVVEYPLEFNSRPGYSHKAIRIYER